MVFSHQMTEVILTHIAQSCWVRDQVCPFMMSQLNLTSTDVTLMPDVDDPALVPDLVSLCRITRVSWWSSRPSWAHCDLRWPYHLWSLRPQTNWEDWEAQWAPLRRDLLILCPVRQRPPKQVGPHTFLWLVFIRTTFCYHQCSSWPVTSLPGLCVTGQWQVAFFLS